MGLFSACFGVTSAPMTYLIAFFIPPLGVLLAGRIITALVLFVVWLLLIVFAAIVLGHILTVIIAWVIIASANGDRRHRELVLAASDKPKS